MQQLTATVTFFPQIQASQRHSPMITAHFVHRVDASSDHAHTYITVDDTYLDNERFQVLISLQFHDLLSKPCIGFWWEYRWYA